VEYKRFPVAEFKADGEKPGHFKALVAVVGNVDDGGDRIIKGAFADVLAKDNKLPIVWSHQWNIPPIGIATGTETDKGLEIDGRLLLNDPGISGQYANSVQSGFNAKALTEFSFAYEVSDSASVEEDGEPIREIKSFKRVFEVGPTLVGMNDSTQLLEAASLGSKALDELADKIVKRLKEADVGRTFYIQQQASTATWPEEKVAIAPHSTSVVEGTWDKATAMMAASNSDNPAAAFRAICAWYSGSNPDQRQSYKFPHHATPGGPANLNGVRNALSRVPQANIPSGDVAGVQRHLNHHLEAAKATSASQVGIDEELDARIARARSLLTQQPA